MTPLESVYSVEMYVENPEDIVLLGAQAPVGAGVMIGAGVLMTEEMTEEVSPGPIVVSVVKVELQETTSRMALMSPGAGV